MRSDGLFFVWVLEFLVLFLLRMGWETGARRKSLFLYVAILVVSIICVKFTLTSDVRAKFECLATNYSIERKVDFSCNTNNGVPYNNLISRLGYSDPQSKAVGRLTLWTNGINTWIKSPWFGHGPGAFSWMYDFKVDVPEVHDESHNILIDLISQGGIFLGVFWLYIFYSLLSRAYNIKDSYTFSIVLMIFVFTMFHYHLRQPYLWFVLAISDLIIRRKMFSSVDCPKNEH